MRLARAATAGLAGLAGLTGALAGPAGAQDPAPGAPAPSPSPTPTPTPTATPTATPEDLGTFTVDIPEPPLRRDYAPHRRSRSRPTPSPGAVRAPTAAPGGADPATERPPPPNRSALPASRVSAAVLDSFRIPPFLLPIYQAAGAEYGVRWEVLAAINEIETDDGRNLNVSSAGALGWMQFMPASWRQWGVDANRDGLKDPYSPVDSIFAAGRYLRAAGADTDIRRAVFAYNHADWYVDAVLARARGIAALPAPLVGALTGLAQGRFPVAARTRYPAHRKGRRGLELRTRAGARAIAVSDGRVVRVGRSRTLGRFVSLQDAYGNLYTYARLGRTAETYPVPRERPQDRRVRIPVAPKADPAPRRPASDTTRADRRAAVKTKPAPVARVAAKSRLFAHPQRSATRPHGGAVQLAEAGYRPLSGAVLELNRRDYRARKLRPGARVLAGTILGRVGHGPSPHMLFEIRPAGRGAPRIDPRPVLDGWRLLESTAIFRATDGRPRTPTLGQVLLMSKPELQRQVLTDRRLDVYACGRRDIRLGGVDRRVLAVLEFLAGNGMNPTVTSLRCGHGFLTTSGNVSEHSSGNAVDIAAINGESILGHQGPGSVTERAIRSLLELQGPLAPHQIISLMAFDGSPSAFSQADHADHIHVGFSPTAGFTGGLRGAPSLAGGQWPRLVRRLAHIDQPVVRTRPSRYAVRVRLGVPPRP